MNILVLHSRLAKRQQGTSESDAQIPSRMQIIAAHDFRDSFGDSFGDSFRDSFRPFQSLEILYLNRDMPVGSKHRDL